MMHNSLITIKEERFCVICGREVDCFESKSVRSSTYNMDICYDCIKKNAEQDKDKRTFHLIIPRVTPLEEDVIMNGIAKSEFFDDSTNSLIWSDTLIEECKITTPSQLTGVVESLVKKELVTHNGPGASATIQLTAEGYTYYLTHRDE